MTIPWNNLHVMIRIFDMNSSTPELPKDQGDKWPEDMPALSKGLYVVATPIGHLEDMTFRALRILKTADLILCEDTRTTAKLCQAYGIHTKRQAFHEHNEKAAVETLLERLLNGEIMTLVSDAGTPLISDPGYALVRACQDKGVPVYPIPGASALISALSVAGLPTDYFIYKGFLPAKEKARRDILAEMTEPSATYVFFETPHRLKAMLEDCKAIGIKREMVVARELTKKFEEITRGHVDDLIASYHVRPEVKGEIVVLFGPAPFDEMSDEEIKKALINAFAKGLSVKEAAKAVSENLGLKKSAVYALALEVKSHDE
jgi:16S rRNA (cytidine1402-2'-O)-methyltransferase